MSQEAENMSPEKPRQQEFSEWSAREDSCAERELGTSAVSSPPASNKELSAWKKKNKQTSQSQGKSNAIGLEGQYPELMGPRTVCIPTRQSGRIL